MTSQKAAVALSGGVDSAVTALLLKEEGYEVSGVTLKLQSDKTTGIEAATRIAEHLGIELKVLDLREYFSEVVIEPFCRDYATGKTPNPCVWCNRSVKFGALLEFALKTGHDFLATGHYCRIDLDSGASRLQKGLDPLKDQSYFLYSLSEKQLTSILFPLGTYTKVQVRHIAQHAGLDKVILPEESQDICFIPGGNYQDLIAAHFEPVAGEIVDSSGSVRGRHQGIFRYTIGQRHGMGIASSTRMYVRVLDYEKNRIVLGTREELFCNEFFINNSSWVAGSHPNDFKNITVKTRYKGTEVPLKITFDGTEGQVILSSPLWAVAPGQSAVFYRGDEVIGGGVVTRTV